MKQNLFIPSSTVNLVKEGGQVEPGLLPVFRTVIGLHLALLLFGGIYGFTEAPSGDYRYLPPLLHALGLLPLLLYLFWSGARRWLGRAYLPLALAYLTLLTLVSYGSMLLNTPPNPRSGGGGPPIEAEGWLLLLRLLLPLVLVAWQYRFSAVVSYIVGVTLIDLTLMGWLGGRFLGLPIGMLIARTLIYALVGIIITRIMAGQRHQREILAEANAQLTHYATTLEQLTISRERNRLAHELHDTLAHTLSAVSVQLEAVDSAWEANPGKARELLNKSLAQTRSGLTETRRALQALRASAVEDLGVCLAVHTLAESTAQRGGLRLEFAGDSEFENLTSDHEHQIYRIAQEALNNVLKHAHARTLRVQLKATARGANLTVADDGVGFVQQTTGANGHYGLRGMAERAELMGATLAVESALGQGTTVRLTL